MTGIGAGIARLFAQHGYRPLVPWHKCVNRSRNL